MNQHWQGHRLLQRQLQCGLESCRGALLLRWSTCVQPGRTEGMNAVTDLLSHVQAIHCLHIHNV